MKLSTAVARRVSRLLQEKNISQYRLERNIAMPHNTMKSLMAERCNGVNLRTVLLLARGLDMTLAQFFDDPIFDDANLEAD